MPTVVRTGARAVLDEQGTDDEFLAVFVGFFAELDDGRVVGVAADHHHVRGPRRGPGAVWVRYDGDVAELPGFDPELFARDPDEAYFEALESSYRLQAKDIEDEVRLRLFEGGFAMHASAGASDVENNRRENERARDATWGNLVRALRTRGVDASPASLRRVPFRMEFDTALLAELER